MCNIKVCTPAWCTSMCSCMVRCILWLIAFQQFIYFKSYITPVCPKDMLIFLKTKQIRVGFKKKSRLRSAKKYPFSFEKVGNYDICLNSDGATKLSFWHLPKSAHGTQFQHAETLKIKVANTPQHLTLAKGIVGLLASLEWALYCECDEISSSQVTCGDPQWI
jgi:hypothetical protein